MTYQKKKIFHNQQNVTNYCSTTKKQTQNKKVFANFMINYAKLATKNGTKSESVGDWEEIENQKSEEALDG